MATLADQLGWCITTKDYLNGLNQELIYVSGQYKNSVEELGQHGYYSEWLPEIQMMQRDFETEVRNLVSYIENDHLEYVDTESKRISGLI